jgi:hypothetical protein
MLVKPRLWGWACSSVVEILPSIWEAPRFDPPAPSWEGSSYISNTSSTGNQDRVTDLLRNLASEIFQYWGNFDWQLLILSISYFKK